MSNQERVEQLLQRVKQENAMKCALARQAAQSIPGKEPFDLNELKKFWQYRYEGALSAAELEDDMRALEDQFYLAGARFLTMESFGRHLMEMELYR